MRAAGGLSTVENITLHCAAHNLYQAELDFGADYIATIVKNKRDTRTGAEPFTVREPTATYRLSAVPSACRIDAAPQKKNGAPLGDPGARRLFKPKLAAYCLSLPLMPWSLEPKTSPSELREDWLSMYAR